MFNNMIKVQFQSTCNLLFKSIPKTTSVYPRMVSMMLRDKIISKMIENWALLIKIRMKSIHYVTLVSQMEEYTA